MNPTHTPTFFETVFASGIGAAIVAAGIAVLLWGLRSYFGSYLSSKAGNLATKEDIQELTRLQEEVKTEFDKIRENQRTEGQLRLAVVEQRFQKHQEAHTLWLKLVSHVHSEDNTKTVMECQKWWRENSLYLDKEARTAFIHATNAAFNHPSFLKSPRDKNYRKFIEENWSDIMKAGALIESAVNLPRLDVGEIQNPDGPKLTASGD
jgi:hypothetical protein